MRFYYGSADGDVSPACATRTAERMQALGADVTAVDVGDFDHNESVVEAFPAIIAWFGAFAPE